MKAPAAPVIGTATPAIASAVVSWTAPVTAGGSAITQSSVRVVEAATGAQVGLLHSAAAGVTSVTVTSLTASTANRFQVLATNAVGTGPYSALSNAVTAS